MGGCIAAVFPLSSGTQSHPLTHISSPLLPNAPPAAQDPTFGTLIEASPAQHFWKIFYIKQTTQRQTPSKAQLLFKSVSSFLNP